MGQPLELPLKASGKEGARALELRAPAGALCAPTLTPSLSRKPSKLDMLVNIFDFLHPSMVPTSGYNSCFSPGKACILGNQWENWNHEIGRGSEDACSQTHVGVMGLNQPTESWAQEEAQATVSPGRQAECCAPPDARQKSGSTARVGAGGGGSAVRADFQRSEREAAGCTKLRGTLLWQAEDWASVEAGAGHRALAVWAGGAIFRTVPITASMRALVGCEEPLLPLLQTEEGPSSRLVGEWSRWGSLGLGGGFSRANEGRPSDSEPTNLNGVALAGGGRWALRCSIWGLVGKIPRSTSLTDCNENFVLGQ